MEVPGATKAFSFGILESATVPVVVISLWMWYYFGQLEKRPSRLRTVAQRTADAGNAFGQIDVRHGLSLHENRLVQALLITLPRFYAFQMSP